MGLPIYEYECEECSTRFEVRRSFHDTSMESCPRCEGDTRRVFQPTAVIYKGSGFYVTDSRKHTSPSGGDSSSG
ncbi:MAG: FmdB family transcriptional regulator [Dehalococcoidales bacterium]|nr:FmdB family transcriptional regulator [Dehalococcoidales bacterium]